MIRTLALILTATWAAWAEPRIIFSKSFPGSTPPLCIITLERDGKAVYKESADDDQPIKFEMSKTETDEIFALAEKVEHFKRQLESGLKVANMGMKTFRWENGADSHETKFNFTQDLDGRAAQDWFEKMIESAQHYIALERSVKFDKLGANKAILQLQAAMERNRLVALAQYIPLLERVVKNDSYLNMARERAATIIEMIRTPKPAKPE